ncbi:MULTISPECIES: exodeoxyribonuclease V subunit alpha [unclassified Cobetia]|uniref:exodeoxyribonuclease V subunit alpha n=1 Tax=unclassified Cobetia TaxID=2609414 RepID=UPI00159D3FC3|nr:MULTISPECIES: exodeoxyribonuclease V subunit alpha [unclassified Cobetia]MCO7232631.1 exodeoxyribonuclease V subunit alpha [Cobetia sp. Dlab-2-AX]MCO7235905.1 exodeoxyribonuclease V subunit alpha [Cobetia sp. Dlab-2-U]NVN54674.1 exodeoxyribonuclease V subunit alpha [bacterium Scap17]
MSDVMPVETRRSAASSDQLLATLGLWVELGWLRRVDAHLVRFMARHVPEAPASVLLAAALASHQLGRGHVCLSLSRALAEPRATLSLPPLEQSEAHLAEVSVALPEAFLADLDATRWAEQLASSRLVSVLAQADAPAGHLSLRPLVLVGDRLYLRRYWQAEREVAAGLRARMGPSEEGETRVSDALGERLRELFAGNQPDPHGEPDWQKLACALALRQRLTVISGGPGTGKTTTVTRLLALLQAQALAGGADGGEGEGEGETQGAETGHPHERRALDIRLVAPTGKAAARLSESIRGAVAKLEVPDAVRAAIPREASTVHRLLGARPDSRHFRHHAGNPLALDLLVVDEASMVDLDLMAALLGALPAHARLILLGDKDQLASVEAGAVLGDLCEHALPPRYSPALCDDLARLTGETLEQAIAVPDDQDPEETSATRGRLADHVVVLQKSYRFSADSGIGALARASNAGDRQALRTAWKTGYSDIAWLKLSGPEDRDLERLVINGYRPALEAVRERRPAREVIDLLLEFQLLCALRRGPYGVDGLNQRVARVLMRRGLIIEERGWYAGRPVMVTRNDRALGLYNGDVGITLPDPAAGGRLRVFFPVEEEATPDTERDGQDTDIQRFHRGVRAVLPSRLEAVETVFAMTVHKSQGSEFRHVVFVLPEGANPILTRELVYTGITRAKSRVTLAGTRRETLEGAIERRVVRASGLVL